MEDLPIIDTLPIKRRNIDSKFKKSPNSADDTTIKYIPGLLVADCKSDCVPIHVQNLFQRIFGKQQNPNECESHSILMMLIYIVALEMGFITPNRYEELRQILFEVPTIAAFHSANVKRLCQKRPNFVSTNLKSAYIMHLGTLSVNNDEYMDIETRASQLTVIVDDSTLIVNLTPPKAFKSGGFSTLLIIENYVKITKSNNIFERLHNLNGLALKLREQIFVPMRCLYMQFTEASVYAGLGGLPEMVATILTEYLDKADIGRLAQVNQRLNSAVKWSRFQK